MAEAPVASPGSTADSGKKPAVKNTSCRYCGTPFTTSSLGRHLDLYIRETNPKPPDGIHDVEEIRRLRGNVTRRQAKSSTKGEGSTPSNAKPASIHDQRSPSAALQQNGKSPANGAQKGEMNRAGWQATGVINGLPVSRVSPSRLLSRAEGSRSNKQEIARKEVAIDERDRTLAVELALKEVLENVRAASMRAHPPSPFDFDFFRLGFPGLCLRCMPPPRSMSSHHSNLGQETWPLDPPGRLEFEYVKRYTFAKVQEWKARITLDDQHSDHIGEIDPQLNAKLAREEPTYHNHVLQMYSNWQGLPEEKKLDEWRLECQKAYAEEYDRHQETRDRLDQLEQEIHHLRDRVNQPKNTQSSSGLGFSPLPLSRATIATLSSQQARDLHQWDYNELVNKWKLRIREQRSTQHMLPNLPPYTPKRALNGTPSTYDQHSYHEERDHEMGDEDLADAPGDDEEEDMMKQNVLDPKLRHGNGNLDDGERMLVELKNFQETNGDGGPGR
ncbi:MAG: hypothetical protein Q9201_005183 [Fulgogasparrea decipioides]